ncbi:hypothetical protein L484_027046 [Morus notabilis]|uniref:Uncharacterized protein n=1 Tax=Morus notabilis TaxID=981085 RepID=W9S0S5_9ROSA|nr:uncharacterized protein LOC21409674 [Morus notabilis]EXC20493.1 hypothetical protein L484_027046 [Morus notabilis]
MAVELCSEKSSSIGASTSSTGSTPRISFSYDFIQSDVVPIEQRPLRSNSPGLNSSIDFDFCVRESFGQESSSADELFSDGKILPTDQIKKKTTTTTTTATPTTTASVVQPIKLVSDRHDAPQPDQTFQQTHGARDENTSKSLKSESKSFWRFKRSSSCGSGYGRTLCPLPLLSRSNSTGSADETKPININSNVNKASKQNISHKYNNASTKLHQSHQCQKPPLKKGHGGYGNGVSINPVLNVPPANLFAIGSIFSNGKNNKNKKK